ncbi:hypothetical protein HELRODRAFT_163552 [Helobdella robusta]|uniref:Uncharacterized protein n=1 Tax=Helobdella robusta TaxID=6412 RepID=T1EU72_HELRO|nr:hypothetical protein HELRODRAFT_163552 [Helobdella robusta]ESN96485.1 hypothetical protein HELRODRAFT_163552 [Helobdella robusta]
MNKKSLLVVLVVTLVAIHSGRSYTIDISRLPRQILPDSSTFEKLLEYHPYINLSAADKLYLMKMKGNIISSTTNSVFVTPLCQDMNIYLVSNGRHVEAGVETVSL